MKLKLRIYGDPVLRQKATAVAKADDRIRQLASDMLETMYAEEGIGLAAQQVGEPIALCVVDVPAKGDTDEEGVRFNPDAAMPLVLINPKIVESSEDTDVYEEGCLSFPDIRANIERPWEVVVQYLDRDGKPQEGRFCAMVGRCIQHEMDHLEGVLLSDRMSAVKKIAISGRLKRLRLQTQEDLGLL